MDSETKHLIEKLEARIVELELNGEFRWKQVKDNFHIAHERLEEERETSVKLGTLFDQRLKWLEEWRDKTAELVKDIASDVSGMGKELTHFHRQAQKLTEVYYQVFPERLDQDLRIQAQMDALLSKTALGAPPKKS